MLFLISLYILTDGTIITDELRSIPHINPTLICANGQIWPAC